MTNDNVYFENMYFMITTSRDIPRMISRVYARK